MLVTWPTAKQVLNIATGQLVDLPAGKPWEMDDEEAVQRIDQEDCAPVDKAEFKAKKAVRVKRLADEAKAKADAEVAAQIQAGAIPAPEEPAASTEPAPDEAPQTGVRVRR